MLKYKVRLSPDVMKKEEMVWREKYLAPDLSFVTGVTSQDYHLEKYDTIEAANSINDRSGILNLETENVEREGYVVLHGMSYDVFNDTFFDYQYANNGTVIDYKYVKINDKYYYTSGTTFIIDNWLVEDPSIGKPIETSITAIIDNDIIKLDTIRWIEDWKVTIDGDEYIYDNIEDGLKYTEDGEILDASDIANCESIQCIQYNSSKEYDYVTKFILTKDDEENERFDRINQCKYFFYVPYKNHYCPIVQKMNGDSYEFKCEIPKYVLNETSYGENYEFYEIVEKEVYFLNEIPDNGDAEYIELNSNTISQYNLEVLDLQDLKKLICYVKIDEAYFLIENDLMNSNDGRKIAVYLESHYPNISVGERIWFKDNVSEDSRLMVYKANPYGFNDNESEFVVFGGEKYRIEPNICDKAQIEGLEYEIRYTNNKKVVGEDCFVKIGTEEVPMKLISDNMVERYGKIVSGDSKSAITATYEVKSYSGVVINDKRYFVNEDENYQNYVIIDNGKIYPFIVTEIRGSSLLVCEPDLNDSNFTHDFYLYLAPSICQDVVDNQRDSYLYVKNKIFGEKEITKELAFQNYLYPQSSDDYYDIFNDLILYANVGYINLSLNIGNKVENNMMQEDLVKNDFFEKKRKESINPIVDMEKDVYLPKYISSNNGRYNGSETEFNPIKEININLHFRTRNDDNWKINEGYSLADTSGETDNWFVTDLPPYKHLIGTNRGDELQSASDLLGFLYFTNDDVFYQKSSLAKSFLRLSFYDSTDPNTQSLLGTSCIFIDEHVAFKRYIDNSQKYVRDYGVVPNNGETAGTVVNKISVRTEYLGDKIDSNKNLYLNDCSGIILDEEHRMSSRLIIKNKYETDTSSEGFYIYIFREYSENLTPKPIYMKVEFNHAKVGRTLPFMLPMKWKESDNEEIKTPDEPYSLRRVDDVDSLKKGYPLSYVNNQLYIPLYAVYDFKNKEYGYVFDNRYISQEKQNKGVIELNLFELKVMDESGEAVTEKELGEIVKHNQDRAIIDVNDRQFPSHEIKCDLTNESNAKEGFFGTDDEQTT